MKNLIIFSFVLLLCAACNHQPKPISNNIAKTTVSVNGKKDSVINNPEKNYGNATVSEICVKCLLQTVQNTDSYKKLSAGIPAKNIIYDVNWITSKTPFNLANGSKIINGMEINVNNKTADTGTKRLTTFLYNNENALFYLLNDQHKFMVDAKIDSVTLKKIRRSCFWGVASAK